MLFIASWGSSGAGKTTVALALAAALAKRKKDVLVLSTDSRTPSLPVFLPTVQGLSSRSSVAELLARSEITQGGLKDRILKHPKSDHIFFMGVASGEVATLTYGPPRREAVMNLLQLLQQAPFQYIIIDCDSNPVLDVTTLIALEWAQFGICTLSPDVKGYEYLKAQMGWLGNSDSFRVAEYVKVLSQIEPTTPVAEADALFGGIRYRLPRSHQVRDRFVAGELLLGFDQGPAITFECQIGLLADEIEEANKHATTDP